MKSVLFFARNYHASSMGGIRIRRIARYLSEFGYVPTVIAFGTSNKETVSPSIRLVNVSALDLSGLFSKMSGGRRNETGMPVARSTGGPTNLPASRSVRLSTWVNRWFMFPDKEIPWLRPALSKAVELHREKPFDLVFASIHPKTSGLAAARFAFLTGCRFAVEYRDAWTDSVYEALEQPTRFHRRLHRRLEKKVLKQADLVSCVCQGLADALVRKYPDETKGKWVVNYNFFDPAETPPFREKPRRPLTILYSGSMYWKRRPDTFLDGLSRWIRSRSLSPADIRFRWMGKIVGIPDIAERIAQYGLETYTDYMGECSHAEALRALHSAHLSLLIQAPNDSMHIPGKLFEAMGAGTPLLALANVPELENIMSQCGAGIYGPHDPAFVEAALQEFWDRHSRHEPWPFKPECVSQYSKDRVMAKFAHSLDRVAQARSSQTEPLVAHAP